MPDQQQQSQSDNGADLRSRDAWVRDGFAPLPGDTISLPSGDRVAVQTVYLCSEPSGDALTRWTWVVLADGRLLEIAPRGCALYDPPQVLARGGGRFLELAAQDGALIRFEERVRAGTWEDRPVRLTLGERRWRLTSTGTVTSQRLGPVPESAWSQLRIPHPPTRCAARISASPTSSPARGRGGAELPEEQDVYFTFASLTDADTLGLGLWATDIVLAFGRRLGDSPAAAGLTSGR
jgi:hypothetical protein